MTPDYPFTVQGGGPPSMFTGYPILGAILKGGPTSHYGVVVGVPCRIVEDPQSPLRFTGIGELTFTKREVRGLDTNERWVVLGADMDVLRAYSSLWGKQVRIEYPKETV